MTNQKTTSNPAVHSLFGAELFPASFSRLTQSDHSLLLRLQTAREQHVRSAKREGLVTSAKREGPWVEKRRDASFPIPLASPLRARF